MNPNITYPRVPLKDMDGAMLSFELFREIDKLRDGVGGIANSEHEKILSAAMIATDLHRDQTRFVRKNLPRVPYIEHPLRNTLRMIRWGCTDSSQLTASLLHDTVEDQSEAILTRYKGIASHTVRAMTPDEQQHQALLWIAQSYGRMDAALVQAVTNPLHGPETDKSASWLNHVTKLAQRRDAVGKGGIIIKASDLSDNAGSLSHQYEKPGIKDSFITTRLEKYAPGVDVIRDAAMDFPNSEVMNNVHQSMHDLSINLRILKQKVPATTTTPKVQTHSVDRIPPHNETKTSRDFDEPEPF